MREHSCGESGDTMSALPCPVADPFAAADQAYATITQFLGSEEARQVKHSDLERQLEEMGRELMRKLLQAHLELRQPGEAVEPVQDAAGATLTPTPAHIRGLESIFGTVEVTRTGYGGEGTASLHPPDGALNLPPEKYSLEVRRRDPPKRKKRWVALVDGNRMEIDHLDRLANEQNLDMPIVVDFIHVAQYVWEAAQALIPEDQAEQDHWVRARQLEILRGKASRVAVGIRRSATLRAIAAAERQAVDDCADYLINYAPYLQYDQVLAEGIPLATGVIEGTCRHLVEDRMNLTGARWSLTRCRSCTSFTRAALQ